MKVSELQTILKKTLIEHGNIEVEIEDCERISASLRFNSAKIHRYDNNGKAYLVLEIL